MIRELLALIGRRARTLVASELVWWAEAIAPYAVAATERRGGRVRARVVSVATDEHTARVVLSQVGRALDEELAAQLGDQ